MQNLSKDEMKKVMGGVSAPPDGGSWCSTTFNCSDGSKQTLTYENPEAGCVGVDASNNPGGNGYGYYYENGWIVENSCGTTN